MNNRHVQMGILREKQNSSHGTYFEGSHDDMEDTVAYTGGNQYTTRSKVDDREELSVYRFDDNGRKNLIGFLKWIDEKFLMGQIDGKNVAGHYGELAEYPGEMRIAVRVAKEEDNILKTKKRS